MTMNAPTTEQRESSIESVVYDLTIAYKGTAYHGWQVQHEVATVQGEIQSRLRRLLREPELELAGTSRTDAGVHALGQHASFSLEQDPEIEPQELRRRLNRWLPKDIRIVHLCRCSPTFHARFSACAKAYTYNVVVGENCSPFELPYIWHRPQKCVDLETVWAVAETLEGEHDFRNLSVNPRVERGSTVRTLHRVEAIPDGNRLYFNVIGSGFLYKMVRTLAGLLMTAADNKLTPEDVSEFLAAEERAPFIDTAPPDGLFLAAVFFEENEWQEYTPQLPPYSWRM